MKKRTGFTLVELLVVIAIVALLLALILPAVQQAREAARKMQCKNNLKQIGLALHNYHDVHRIFPPAWNWDYNWPLNIGLNPVYGWSTALLPYLEQKNLYDALQVGIIPQMPYPNSTTLPVSVAVPVFLCPSDSVPTKNPYRDNFSTSSYVGSNGMGDWYNAPDFFHFSGATRLVEITDGTSQTFAVGERNYKFGGAGLLGRGNYFRFAPFKGLWDNFSVVSVPPNVKTHDEAEMGFSSSHAGGVQFLFVDGHVQFISDSIDRKTYEALGTIGGAEVIGEF